MLLKQRKSIIFFYIILLLILINFFSDLDGNGTIDLYEYMLLFRFIEGNNNFFVFYLQFFFLK